MVHKAILNTLLCLLLTSYAEVTVTIEPSDKKLSFTWENSASLPYYLGGVRFYTDGYVHPNLSSMTNWEFTQKEVGDEKEQILLYKSSIATVQPVSAKGGSFNAFTLDDYSGKPVEGAKRHELLLKTGSAGKVDDPITADPIDTNQIDSLIKTANFYNEEYRYIDTLGAHGGLYSGGIMDTWLGETQVICHFSDETWNIHGTEQVSFTLDATGGDPLFWMSVIMGQEYFHADMQWMLGKGAQETGAGTGSYNGTNAEGAFGPWEVETGTGTSREQAYPYFFEHGTIKGFWEDASSPLNSANVVNGYIYSIVCVRYMYDLWNYATDACWKEILVNSASRYYALSILLGGYNNGIGDAQNVLKEFWHVDSYENFINDPNAHMTVEAKMNKSYVPGVIGGVKNLEEGSKAAFTDKSLELIDMELTLKDIQRFFYGDGGDHTSQGDGGLLAHFDVDRNAFNTLIETAFRKLKGKAPSTQGKEAISLRYDFLTLLRVVKGDFQVTWSRPTGPGEWTNAVKQQSQKGGCDSLESDEEYPYGEVEGAPEFITDFVVDIHSWDNQAIKEVLWTMDSSWSKWHKATYKSGSDDDQLFTITIPRDDIKEQFGDNTGTYWYMVTDESGNSVIKSDIIKGNPIKYAAAFDYDGDGFTDSLKVAIVKGALAPAEKVADFVALDYAWPGKSPLTSVNANYTINDSYIMIHSITDDAGAGLGESAITYPSMTNTAKQDILDSVGPAITFATLFEGMSEDSLFVVPSEEVQNINSKDYEYLYFSKGSTETRERSREVIALAKDTLLFLFDTDVASDKDSVRFVFDSELTDTAGVKPQSNNIRIPIKQNGTPAPTLDSALALDTKGDGMADEIKLYFTPSTYSGAYDISNYKDMKYSWPTKNNLMNPDNIVQKGNNLTLFDAELTLGDGVGKVSFSFGTTIFDEEIVDRIGPAIKSAVLHIDDADRDKDTLLLVVSEGLSNYDKKDHSYLFLDSLFETQSEKVIKIDSLTYQFIFDKDVVAKKDSVKFIFSDDGIQDGVGNNALDINQWVQISIIGGKEPTLKSAKMIDLDGDGRGDSVTVHLNLGKAADRYSVSDIIRGKYSWPGTSLSKELASTAILNPEDDHFGFLYDSKSESGEGAIELYFPDSYALSGKIADKVGPAIDSAICLQMNTNRDSDTLLLEVSETLKENFSDDAQYLILFADSSDSDGDTVQVATIEKDDLYYRFILEKDAVQYGDWVQFLYNSGLEDEANNAPLTINKKVLINVLGGVTPRISRATIYDVKGSRERIDGNGDSIFVHLSLAVDPKALTVDSLKEVSYSWGGSSKTAALSELMRIDESTFAIIDEELTGGAGTGTITLLFDNEQYEVKGTIEDSVAPVITAAKYYNWSDVEDTLVVTFSEELSETGSATPFLVTGETIEVKSISENGNSATYAITNGAMLTAVDSIWIKGNEKIVDTKENELSTDMNIQVPLQYFRVASLTSAAYFETDERPDGYIDQISLSTDVDINKETLSSLLTKVALPTERHLTINGISRKDTRTLHLSVSQDKSVTQATTACHSFDTLSTEEVQINDTLIISSTGKLPISDSIAPVILSARFIPAEEDNQTLFDTLRLTYSEEVRQSDQEEPFRFSDASDDDSEYSLEFENKSGGTVDVIYTNEYNQANVLPGLGDSVWIDDNGEISDKNGLQQNRDSRAVPLTVGTYTRDYKVSISPVPFYNSYYDDSLVTIRIQPGTRKLPDNLQAEFVIFDKVGNEIMKISKEEFGVVEDDMLSYSFQPRNSFKRKLGGGSYSVQLFITAEGVRQLRPLQLAIQEEISGKE